MSYGIRPALPHGVLPPATIKHAVFFTDLDRCLPTSTTGSVDEARPALDALKAANIPVVFVSGRTRAEIEPLRQALHHDDPFIVEHGAAAFVPRNTFDFALPRSRRRSSYDVVELGTPYAMLRDVLKQVEEAVNTPLRGFGDLSVEDIMHATGLSRTEALRAKLREYDEPFLFKGPVALQNEVVRQIGARGLRCVYSEGLFHVTGANDVARAGDILLAAYRRKWSGEEGQGSFETVAIGETLHDLPLMSHVDRVVLLQRPDGSYDDQAHGPGLIRAPGIGCAGWRQAVADLLKLAA
jgi:mannosyl-3-phosphoglycerate phosphatase